MKIMAMIHRHKDKVIGGMASLTARPTMKFPAQKSGGSSSIRNAGGTNDFSLGDTDSLARDW